ncbi:stage III sporulation protein AB [Anaerospora hongkongensis]|uniref:stage III sporulation protein AB n=1 Tax=Anaerospora hongkongensis TaxID=244830 RepID=UPI002896D9F7|nr:stage III sporulation protein AB [Anaerospora hongkongensis]
MWLKIAGSVLLLSASIAIGFHIAWRYAERPRQIRQLLSCLAALQSYICVSAIPLGEAFRLSAGGVDGPVARLFHRTGCALTENARTTPDLAFWQMYQDMREQLLLEKTELEIIQLFSSNLGMMNREEQEKKLIMIQGQLQKVEAEALAKREPNMKMYRYLGVCGGLAAVIMLI